MLRRQHAQYLQSKRSDILQELARRSEEASRAEQTLLDARRGLVTSALNPGGPLDIFRALKKQFNSAIRSGDADAAAGLASDLLSAGRGIFASGTGYAELFRTVNEQLLGAQRDFHKRAGTIDAALDQRTYKEVAEAAGVQTLLQGAQRRSNSEKELLAEAEKTFDLLYEAYYQGPKGG